MRTSEILNLAADRIESQGWVQGYEGWYPETAGLCLEGGIVAAMGLGRDAVSGAAEKEFTGCPAYLAVMEYVADDDVMTWYPVPRLYNWNDAPRRTAEEVIEVLRACALIEEAREERLAAVTETVPA